MCGSAEVSSGIGIFFTTFVLKRQLHLMDIARSMSRRPVHAAAVVDSQGIVHDADSDWAELLSWEWPRSTGDSAPTELLRWLHKPSLTAGRPPTAYQGLRLVATAIAAHDVFVVTLRERLREDGLSRREHEVSHHYAAGLSHKEIAGLLGIAPPTVRAHLRSVFRKLQISSKVGLISAQF